MHELTMFLRSLGPTPARDVFVKAVRRLMGRGARTSLQFLRHVAAGRKTPSVELCIAIEKASETVRCEALRPDVDWVYLAGRVARATKKSGN